MQLIGLGLRGSQLGQELVRSNSGRRRQIQLGPYFATDLLSYLGRTRVMMAEAGNIEKRLID